MYTPNDKTLLQLGLYDYVWGDNSMLQNYLSRIEAEKNRNEQRAYNEYLKEYDRAKSEAEQSAAYKKELKEAEVRKVDEQRQRDAEKARLYKLYNESEGAAEKAYIAKQIAVLEGRDTENADDVKDEMLMAYDQDKAAKEEAENQERERKHRALDTLAKIDAAKRKAKTATQKEALAKAIAADTDNYPYLTQEERDKIVADIRGIKTLDEMMQDAANNAAAQAAGTDTANRIAWQKVRNRSKEPGYVPTSNDKAVAKQNGYHWDKKLQTYVK